MLTIGTDSRCDICLDPFDNGDKNPHAIRCGHMFCAGCIGGLAHSSTQNYPGNSCPLCRQPFSLHTDIWKLHVDLDPRRRGNPSIPQPTAEQEDEAERLRVAFYGIATEGADEARTRTVLQSITDFTRPFHRDLYWDLRMVSRLLAYTCDVRSKNRSIRTTLAETEKRVTELEAEIEDCRKKFEDEKTYREERQKAAEASERDLKTYISSLSKTYEQTVSHYNFVVDEWMKQNEEMSNLRAAFSELRNRTSQPNPRANIPPSPPRTRSSFYLSAEEYESRLSGIAVTNPGTLLVSPLPQFTSLPQRFFSFDSSPVPEDTAEVESVTDSWGAVSTNPSEAEMATPKGDCDLLSPPQAAEPTERGANTRRLNDLLSDTPTPAVTSSSLPVTSHFPPAFEPRPRERPRSHSNSHSNSNPASRSPPSRSRPEPAPAAPAPAPVHAPIAAPAESVETAQPANIRVNPPIYDPTAYTSASAAAQAAEKAKRAKQRAGRDVERGRPATPDREVIPKPARDGRRELARQDSRRDYNTKTHAPSTYKYNNGIHPPMLPPRDREPQTVSTGYSSVRGATGYSSRSQPKLQDVFSTDRHMTTPVPLGVSRG